MQLENKENEMPREEQVIDLFELFDLLKGKLVWIIAAAMLGAAIAYAYSSFFIKPIFSATAIVYVNNRHNSLYVDSINQQEITAAARLVPTYQAIVSTKTAMKRAIAEGGIEGYSPEQLLSMISTRADEDTGVFYITARGEDQFYVADIANAVAEVGTMEISKYIEGTTVSVIDHAITPPGKSYPSNSRNAAIGFILGAALCIGLIIIYSILDVRLKKAEDFAKELNAPLLGIIPNLQESLHSHGYGYRTHSKTQRGEKA